MELSILTIIPLFVYLLIIFQGYGYNYYLVYRLGNSSENVTQDYTPSLLTITIYNVLWFLTIWSFRKTVNSDPGGVSGEWRERICKWEEKLEEEERMIAEREKKIVGGNSENANNLNSGEVVIVDIKEVGGDKDENESNNLSSPNASKEGETTSIDKSTANTGTTPLNSKPSHPISLIQGSCNANDNIHSSSTTTNNSNTSSSANSTSTSASSLGALAGRCFGQKF